MPGYQNQEVHHATYNPSYKMQPLPHQATLMTVCEAFRSWFVLPIKLFNSIPRLVTFSICLFTLKYNVWHSLCTCNISISVHGTLDLTLFTLNTNAWHFQHIFIQTQLQCTALSVYFSMPIFGTLYAHVIL